MKTTEHYKLYIGNRGGFILAHHEGHYFLGYDATEAAESLAHFISMKGAEVCLEDYGCGFNPEAYICPVDFAAMTTGEILNAIMRAYERTACATRRLSCYHGALVYDLHFYLMAATIGEGYRVAYLDCGYLPYLVNGDCTGLSEADLIVAEAFDAELEVIAWAYEPDSYGRQDVLCRIKQPAPETWNA